MSDTFTFELVSPEKLVMSEEVRSVKVPGSEGDFQMFAHHAPIMSTLRHGILEIEDANGSSRTMFVRGGLAEGGPTNLTILAEHAVDMDNTSKEEMDRHIQSLEAEVSDGKDEKSRGDAAAALHQIRQLAGSLVSGRPVETGALG